MSDLPAGPGPWGIHTVLEGEDRVVRIGPLALHLAQEAGEIQLAWTREPVEVGGAGLTPAGGTPPAPEEELQWSRWATAEWKGDLSLVPVFPDRPLVVTPEDAFGLLAGARARIYIRVPLWVKVATTGPSPTTLVQIPTVPSSDTWWGTVEDGELAYWLETHARRTIHDELFHDHLAICPLSLVNRSGGDLPVTKIALRVEYLSLFRYRDRQIWSDATLVRYTGETEGSRLEMEGHPPEEAEGAELVSPPRTRMGRGFTARTFARLRSLQDLF